ncbi:MAG: cation diffusion facilitator family transporter [Vulcanococcus sp.]|jgi:cobalt-zinc-cadmium efflux system protein|uniref:cation diffusion facilitator family transporter n=1 Tax=unclassified Vulcanococcus TaxID=2766969 RepID=UPI0025D37B50|nr:MULTISPECIES: cation diffusion facilitator family transporter [unclassified Vulcanococcus]NCV93069.1 cation transporter [Synechococcaceae bacterium WB7_3xG_012]
MGHHDHHHHAGAFRWSVLLNAFLTGAQLAIGFGFGSLALIGDAIHNLGDVVGLLLAWGAERLSLKPPRGRFTYGFGRSTHLAALINGLLVFAAGLLVVVEGLDRLQQPEPLVAGPVAVAAAAGIAINLLSARLFGAQDHLDLNRRAAVLHLLSDAAVSAAVLLSAILVALTGRTELDAITAIAVGAAVMVSAYGLLKQALAASLDAVPEGHDLQSIEAALRELPGVLRVSELHVWGLGGRRVALTAHLQVQSEPSVDLLRLGEERLRQLGIDHSTLQIEPQS